MYKLKSVTDKNDGTNKMEHIMEKVGNGEEIGGEIYCYDMLKGMLANGDNPHCFFMIEGGKEIRTSRVQSLAEYDNLVVITTMNSVYTFESI